VSIFGPAFTRFRVEKYRPTTLDDVVSHRDITTTSMERVSSWVTMLTSLLVEKFIEKNRLPHLLFYGPPGTGKTSTILAVARRIYGPDYRKQILEVRFIPFCPILGSGVP
jgi:replication factor C subunit 3/5